MEVILSDDWDEWLRQREQNGFGPPQIGVRLCDKHGRIKWNGHVYQTHFLSSAYRVTVMETPHGLCYLDGEHVMHCSRVASNEWAERRITARIGKR